MGKYKSDSQVSSYLNCLSHLSFILEWVSIGQIARSVVILIVSVTFLTLTQSLTRLGKYMSDSEVSSLLMVSVTFLTLTQSLTRMGKYMSDSQVSS